jgi:hypothetical protein
MNIEDPTKIKKETGGGEKEKTKACAKCGAENKMDANFCGKCGNKFGEISQDKSSIKIKIPDKFITEKDGKPAISVKDFLRMNKTMDIEEIAEALENSSKKETVLEESPASEEINQAESVQSKSFEKKEQKGEKSLEDQKKEAEDIFLKTLKMHEIRVGDFPENDRKKLIEDTLKEIKEAIDEDFVDLAVAKGMKRALDFAKDLKRTKEEKNEIAEIRKKIKEM